jgi:hypothetical protein
MPITSIIHRPLYVYNSTTKTITALYEPFKLSVEEAYNRHTEEEENPKPSYFHLPAPVPDDDLGLEDDSWMDDMQDDIDDWPDPPLDEVVPPESDTQEP